MKLRFLRGLLSRPVDAPPADDVTLTWLACSDPQEGDRYKLYHHSEVYGQLIYKTCSACKTGLVLKISIYRPLSGRGVGGHLVRHLVDQHRDLTWKTTAHIDEPARKFWRHMAEVCGQPLTETSEDCMHDHAPVRSLDGYTFSVPHPTAQTWG
jgi:GNAT superfamily N-acetyltransferase